MIAPGFHTQQLQTLVSFSWLVQPLKKIIKEIQIMPTIPSKQTVVQIEIDFIGANLLYFEIKINQILIIQLVASRQQRVLLVIGIHIGNSFLST